MRCALPRLIAPYRTRHNHERGEGRRRALAGLRHGADHEDNEHGEAGGGPLVVVVLMMALMVVFVAFPHKIVQVMT